MSVCWQNISLLLPTDSGWCYAERYVAIGPRQRQILSALARATNAGRVQRGVPTLIAANMHLSRTTVWTQIRELKRKFGVTTIHELGVIAKQLSANRERGRSSNRASTLASVTRESGRAPTPHAEALHPGAAPRCRAL